MQLHNADLSSVLNRELVQDGKFIPIHIDEVQTAARIIDEHENYVI